MSSGASGKLTAEWRPARSSDGLTMSMTVADRSGLGAMASRLDPATPVRLKIGNGASVVTTAASILSWHDGDTLPDATGEWPHSPVDRGDGAQAVDMLHAFLAWTKSRGLIDEAAARRISRSVQGEMAGANPDTPR